jgi:hypothetical protein
MKPGGADRIASVQSRQTSEKDGGGAAMPRRTGRASRMAVAAARNMSWSCAVTSSSESVVVADGKTKPRSWTGGSCGSLLLVW